MAAVGNSGAGRADRSRRAAAAGGAVLGLNAVDQMYFIPAYPFWSLMIIAVDVVALDGLCAFGSRQNLAT